MRTRFLFAVLACALASAGPALLAQTAAPTGYPEVGAPAIVTVQSLGAEPRRPLRYVFANGKQESMTMDMAMGMAMDMAGLSMPAMTLPTMHMTVGTTMTAVSDGGNASVNMVVTDAQWISGPGTDPSLLAAVQSTGDSLRGMSYGFTMNNRGTGVAGNLDISKIANPQVAQALGSMTSAMQSMSVPLPEESVGVGATWEVRQSLSVTGLHSNQRMQVELVALDDAGCTLKLQTAQTAPSQPVTNSALPAGFKATLDKYEGTGAGTMTIHFDSVVPASEMSSKNSTTMSVDIGGQSQQIAVTVNLHVTVAPVK